MDVTIASAKSAARRLREHLTQSGFAISHSEALELVAHQLGFRDWNTAVAGLNASTGGGIGGAIPVLRIHDEAVAREFYVDYLGFAVEWEHRFEPGMPLYARLRRDGAVLDLSEHHGDGTPGTVVWMPASDLAGLHRELSGRGHPRLRPGIDDDAPGGPTMTITDPFSNTLRFCQPSAP
ncbi:glyoxalase superfamily protein [Okibacterium endophyticum]